MPFDTGLADRLRKAGLTVKETDGWKSRANSQGSSFFPRGAVTHHTAGAPPSAGVAPSLGVIINGRSDLAGPLANVYMDYDGVVYTIAAGGANHAGSGGWRGLTGNSSVWGLEIEHPGTSKLDEKRYELAARVQAACITGTAEAKMVCQHFEWSTAGKIDVATQLNPDDFRSRVAFYLKHPGEEDEMVVAEGDNGSKVKMIQTALNNWSEANNKGFSVAVDGSWEKGSALTGRVKDFQKALQLEQTGTVDGLTAAYLFRFNQPQYWTAE